MDRVYVGLQTAGRKLLIEIERIIDSTTKEKNRIEEEKGTKEFIGL